MKESELRESKVFNQRRLMLFKLGTIDVLAKSLISSLNRVTSPGEKPLKHNVYIEKVSTISRHPFVSANINSGDTCVIAVARAKMNDLLDDYTDDYFIGKNMKEIYDMLEYVDGRSGTELSTRCIRYDFIEKLRSGEIHIENE